MHPHSAHAHRWSTRRALESPQVDGVATPDIGIGVGVGALNRQGIFEAPLGERLGVVARRRLCAHTERIHEATHHRQHNEHTHEDDDHPRAFLHDTLTLARPVAASVSARNLQQVLTATLVHTRVGWAKRSTPHAFE